MPSHPASSSIDIAGISLFRPPSPLPTATQGKAASKTPPVSPLDEVPYLDHRVRHHGQITLVPPENAPRMGTRRPERPQRKGKHRTNALAPDLSIPTSASSGSTRTIVDYTIPSRPRLKQIASVPEGNTRGDPVRSGHRRPASSTSIRLRGTQSEYSRSSETIATSVRTSRRPLSVPIVPDAFDVPESPPPSFSEALQLSVTPVIPSSPQAVARNEPLSINSNARSTQALETLDTQTSALTGDDDETSKFYIAWERDREAGFSLQERVRREFERRRAAELSMPPCDPPRNTVNSHTIQSPALGPELDCHPSSSQITRALTATGVFSPDAAAPNSSSISSDLVTEPNASRPLPIPPLLSSDVLLPPSAYVSLLATTAQPSAYSPSLTTVSHSDSDEPTTQVNDFNYFNARTVLRSSTIPSISTSSPILDDRVSPHERLRLVSDSPISPNTPFVTPSEPETSSRLNREQGMHPSGDGSGSSLEVERKPDNTPPQSDIDSTSSPPHPDHLITKDNGLGRMNSPSNHSQQDYPSVPTTGNKLPILAVISPTSPSFSKLADRTSPPSSFTLTKSRPRSPVISTAPQSPTKSAGELGSISSAVRDRVYAFEAMATRTRPPPPLLPTRIVPRRPPSPPTPGRDAAFPAASSCVIRDAELPYRARSRSHFPNMESASLVRLDGDHPSTSHPSLVKLSPESENLEKNETQSTQGENINREPALKSSIVPTASPAHGTDTPEKTNASTSASVLVNLESMIESLSLNRRQTSPIPHLPAASSSFMDSVHLDRTPSPQIWISSSRAAPQLNRGASLSSSTPSNIERLAASPSFGRSSPPTNLANPPPSSISLSQTTAYRPHTYSEFTDLDLLVAGLDSPSAAANSGSSYEDLLTISSIIGPAQAGPTTEMNASVIEDLPVAHVEVERRRKTRDGRTKLKLSLMGVVVDRCGVCLSQFKNQDLGVLLPCRHSYHPKCVYPWLRQNMTCPSCRTSIIQT